MLISPRDTVCCLRWVEEGGIINCYGASVKHPKMPEKPDYVRAHIMIWGYVLTPLRTDPNKNIRNWIDKNPKKE